MAEIVTTSGTPTAKTVGDPNSKYDSLRVTWDRSRAILGGQNKAKVFDDVLDVLNYNNLLIPFSPNMTQGQFNFYKAEAELPGLVSQYGKVLVGGLLRKPPHMALPKEIPEEASNWLLNNFGADGASMISVLDEALWEEMQTSRAWVLVEHPVVPDGTELTPAELKELSPYLVIIKAENIINWRRGHNNKLIKLTLRFYEETLLDGAHHPSIVDTVVDYNINAAGKLEVQKYIKSTAHETIPVVNGVLKSSFSSSSAKWIAQGTPVIPLMHGEAFTFIPAYPLNGSIEPVELLLQQLIDREIGLYNKMSRRNHLLYGAATYTPVIASDMDDGQFQNVVNGGLGTWIHVQKGETVTALETPTAALKDMELAIASTLTDMARMGIRMLTPDNAPAESGVALEIKNASQTAQLGLLNSKISKTMEMAISVMLAWKYGIDLQKCEEELSFTLSTDFNPTPLGADWLRLVTEWYDSGKIPRSIFLSIAKQNDILPADYDDNTGQAEIKADDLILLPTTKIDSGLVQ